MSDLTYIDPKELSIVANIIALIIADGRSANEINVLGNLIVAIGSLLTTIAAQQQSLDTILEKQNEAQTNKQNRKNGENNLNKKSKKHT